MEIALALGGGGARGYAHLGVVHVLKKSGFRFHAITGTSAGAIVGSLVAAGLDLDMVENEINSVEMSKIFQRRQGDAPSLLGMSGLEVALRKLLQDRTFKDLETPFAATAVDLHSGQAHIIRDGDVVDAVMASSAVPGFFPPRVIRDCYFIDGSILMPVPVEAARQLAPGKAVVAIVLSPPLSEWAGEQAKAGLSMAIPVMQRFIDRSRVAQSLNIFLQAVDLGSMKITELSLERDPPDVVIRPKVHNVGMLERDKGKALVTTGEDAAFEALDQIKEAVSWRGQMKRWHRRIRFGA